MNIRAYVFYNHPAYAWLAENAAMSFAKWHPDIMVNVVTPKSCHKGYAQFSPGMQKTINAEHVILENRVDKLILLGADTITTGRLTEFLESDEDILHTLDYEGVHPLGYDKPQVNADVVCFNNKKSLINPEGGAIRFINQLAILAGGPYYEQGSQNMSLYGEPVEFPICANLRQMEPDRYKDIEQKKKDRTAKYILENNKKFTHKIIDTPESRVVYNARSKQLPGEVVGDETFKKNIESFKVVDGKLMTSDDRHIKVFHICEGLGARVTNKRFRDLIEKYLGWFNDDTVDFFIKQCNCTDIFRTKKYPKWKDEDKFEFDEYTIDVARKAGLNVSRFEPKEKH